MRLLRKSSFLAAAFVALGASVFADSPEERKPLELEQVGVTEHLNQKVDLNLTFIAEDGYPHALKEYFHAGRPVLLNLVYYTCKMLCNVVLNAQVQSLRKLDWTPSRTDDDCGLHACQGRKCSPAAEHPVLSLNVWRPHCTREVGCQTWLVPLPLRRPHCTWEVGW